MVRIDGELRVRPAFSYELAPREKQLQVPKHLKPLTDTAKQTVGYGGCFSCIYSVRGGRAATKCSALRR